MKGGNKVISGINPFNNKDTDNKWLYIVKVILQYLFIYIVGLLVAEGIVIGLHYALGNDVLNGEMMEANTTLLFKYYGYIISIFTANENFLMGGSYGIEASIITTLILSILIITISRKSKIKE